MIGVKSSGSTDHIEKWMQRMIQGDQYAKLSGYGERGVELLRAATPVDTGLTADSWYYTIGGTRGKPSIHWRNSNNPDGALIAIMLQYGHGTKNGGYVQGFDYINPVMQPLFQQIADDIWKEVSR